MVLRIPLGISNFRELRESGCYFVDKSFFIRDIIDDSSKVLLLPRPRRFGKTLNLSMLRSYFERSTEDCWHLFADLDIARAGERYRRSFQRYPTLYLTFKDIKDESWEGWILHMAKILGDLYEEHQTLVPKLDPRQERQFQAVLENRASPVELQNALLDLSGYLAKHHGQPVMVLLDEYDTPLHTAHLNGYYKPALAFFRTLLSTVLKDNSYLHKGILTGILRVAKDNIFTGLNNIDVYTLLAPQFATAFGFTQAEVEELLARAELSEHLPDVQRWYNGYLFGEQVIYNPWSVLSYVKHRPKVPRPYWSRTSGNDLVRRQLRKRGDGTRGEFEALLRGESIEHKVEEEVALRELRDDPDLLFSLLLFSGYLKVLGIRQLEDGTILGRMAIPNQEVRTIYTSQFAAWLTKGLGGTAEREAFLRALLRGDVELLQDKLSGWLLRYASYHDTAKGRQPERFYHGLVLGLLVSLGPEYEVRSNSESGRGRCDILIAPQKPGRAGVVLEFKVVDPRKKETLQTALVAAKQQIIDRAYAEVLRAKGANPVHELAVAWEGKEVVVAAAR